jgi:UDP-N-acetylmuramoylalanine--D-glutamate ligase
VKTGDDFGLVQSEWPNLQGPHNLENARVAAAICHELGLSIGQISTGLRSFGGLSHRMEVIAQHQGVTFVNDSKATNPASTAPALAAYNNIHWIAGGLPKTDTLDDCAPYFGNVKTVYLIGEAGPAFGKLLSPFLNVVRSEMLCSAVETAFNNAQPGDIILLSPACASFDQFRDFEARGDAFVAATRKIMSERNIGEVHT